MKPHPLRIDKEKAHTRSKHEERMERGEGRPSRTFEILT